MPMSKKHYEALAAEMSRIMWESKTDPATMSHVIVGIAKVCEADNPRFDRARFLTACTNNPSTR